MPMHARFLNGRMLACVLAMSFCVSAARPACARPLNKAGSAHQSNSSPAGAKQRTDPKEWFAKGQTALQSGDLTTAEAAFCQVLAADPRAGSAYANLGVGGAGARVGRKNWDHAITLLQKAEKLE